VLTPFGLFVRVGVAQTASQTCDTSALKIDSGGYVRENNKNKRVIVFVNGIFGDAFSTWTKGSNYWPKMLCADYDFDNVDIYVHSFNSPKIQTAQTIDELAKRMKDYLSTDRVFERHQMVIFICHSMGGLVTRAFLLKTRPSPQQVPMIYFFATPTTGANVAGIAAHLSKNSQLRDMLPLQQDGYVGNLQDEWLATSEDEKLNYPSTIASFCAYEKYDTWGFRIVERQSATNLCNRETRGILADHIDIVKPVDNRGEPYVSFKAAYDRTFSLLTAELIYAAPKMQSNDHLSGWSFAAPVRLARGNYNLWQVTALKDGIQVRCGHPLTGQMRMEFGAFPEAEKVVQVVPTIGSYTNLKSASVALVSYDQKGAIIRYSLQGPDPESVPCLQNAQVQIHANVVTGEDKP